MAENFNSCTDEGEFPCNYRSVSILSNYSKVYEKLIYNQLCQYFENMLFPSQCRFRKGYRSQHGLLVLIKKINEAIDKVIISELFLLTCQKHLIASTIRYQLQNYIGMDFHLYLLTLNSISAIVPIAPK